jgi:hypothetical protein
VHQIVIIISVEGSILRHGALSNLTTPTQVLPRNLELSVATMSYYALVLE